MAEKEHTLTKGWLCRQNALKTFDLTEIVSFFQAYLDGKVTVTVKKQHHHKRKKALSKKALNAPSLDETDLLLASISLIGERIIRKYCKGEQPHYERMKLWDISLQILNDFVEQGILSEGHEIDYKKNGYFLHCIAFNTDTVGDIILPLKIPCSVKSRLAL